MDIVKLYTQVHLPVNVSLVWSGDTSALKEKHWVYYIGFRSFIITALQEKYIFGDIVTVAAVHYTAHTPV